MKRLWWTFVVGYAFMSLWVPGVVARTRAAGLSVSSAVAAGPTSLAVRQVALLTAPAAAGPVMFGAPSFNGGTLAAPGFHLDAVGDVVNGPVTVFGEPSGGWSSSVAPGVFEPPAGEIATAAAAANGAVAVTERSTSAETGDIVVLTRPAGGWSGSLTPTAHLVVASGQPQFGLAAANGAFVTSTPGGPIRVFWRSPPAAGRATFSSARNCRPLTARRCTAWPPPGERSSPPHSRRSMSLRSPLAAGRERCMRPHGSRFPATA